MTLPRETPSSRSRAAERGSAYLLALLVLVVLTVIGLSIAVITQTEVQIGGAEKSAVRAFYNADSGVDIQLAAYQTTREAPKQHYPVSTTAFGGATLTDSIEVAPFLPMYQGPCALCTQNYGSEDRKYAVNFVTNGQGRRISSTVSSDVPQASKLITIMFFTQPMNEPAVNEALRTFDAAVVADNPDEPGLDVIRY